VDLSFSAAYPNGWPHSVTPRPEIGWPSIPEEAKSKLKNTLKSFCLKGLLTNWEKSP
jgi:hypothetical protein